MAHPTIKIDTNVQTSKRSFLEDNDDDDALDVLDEENEDGQGPDGADEEGVPPFLCQSVDDIRYKFDELEWIQGRRMAESLVSTDPSHRWALEGDPQVKARNRYGNVQAWANSRIHLRVPEGECDFINASPIVLKDSSSQAERRYIATQGPKFGHSAHFWNMVFHESHEVGVIVMLTQTFESGREKCAQYFPLDLENPSMTLEMESGDPFLSDESPDQPDRNILGEVTLLETTFNEQARSEVRKLELKVGEESKTVWHFLFSGWADFSKPEGEDCEALLELIRESGLKSGPDSPRVVHCSAGVGRTGTFIALDHLLKELESGKLLGVTDPEEDPVFDTVDLMREQRMMMVYNDMQLHFIYEVLREQANIKLGKAPPALSPGSSRGEERSAKMAKLSNDSDETPHLSPESLHPAEHALSSSRSWSGPSTNDEQ